MSRNKHGLSRKINKNVKKEVRKNSYYGCVICGNGIIQYEHFDPEFKDAKKHDSNGIALLCGRCHDSKTKGLYSTKKVKQAYLNPYNKNNKNNKDSQLYLDFIDKPKMILGSNTFFNYESIIEIYGDKVMSVNIENNVLQINFTIMDEKRNILFMIENNNLVYNLSNDYDFEFIANRFYIRKDNKDIFEMHINARESLHIVLMDMKYRDVSLSVKGDDVKISNAGKQNVNISNCNVSVKKVIVVTKESVLFGVN